MSLRRTAIALLIVTCGSTFSAVAALQDSALGQGVVLVTASADTGEPRSGSGFVIQADRFSGYIVTNVALVTDVSGISVRLPGTNTSLPAQVLQLGTSAALLKVNGLFTLPLTFSRGEYVVGNVVWSVQRFPGEGDYLVSSQGSLASVDESGPHPLLRHNAAVSNETASILVNECGHVLGLNLPSALPIRTPGADYLTRTLGVEGVSAFVGSRNLRLSYADTGCVSAVDEAREEAARAAQQALIANENADQARRVARELERRLSASNQRNNSLVEETRLAVERADEAMKAAEAAEANARETRLELERQTAAIKAETNALMRFLERDRKAAEDRFRQALTEQQIAAESRERLWMSLGAVSLLVAIAVGMLFFRRINISGVIQPMTVSPAPGDAGGEDAGAGQGPAARPKVEYVLDGRDEEGIRYLLRIAGDQLQDGEGIVIGRNPEESPYVINHADVSRKHARMRVMRDRVFIEDLGSTNGTSVNGQTIDDKGPVSVESGDQIIIGSVVMKLRVLGRE